MVKYKILTIESEANIRELIHKSFDREHYEIVEADNGPDGLRKAESFKPDLILLSLSLPGLDGMDVCRELQQQEQTARIPIIALIDKDATKGKTPRPSLGIVDYLLKPCTPRQLIARCASVLKRTMRQASGQTKLELGSIALNVEEQTVVVNQQKIKLTLTEFKLLEDLLRHKFEVRSREQLLDAVWGYSFEGYSRTVDTHIRRLRAKLGQAAEYVTTVRGLGYMAKELPGHEQTEDKRSAS